MTVDLDDLTHLSELFTKLRSGRHLCVEDGPLYLSLRANYERYEAIFRALGFELVQHHREFYYFQSDADLAKEAKRVVVFFFILVQWWGDLGKDIEAEAFRPHEFDLAEFPHFDHDTWRHAMEQSGITDKTKFPEVLKHLDRLGYIERTGEERFRFRAPAWRFLDLCRDVHAQFGDIGTNEARDDDVGESDARRIALQPTEDDEDGMDDDPTFEGEDA
jgi:hypothetical protein